MRAWDAAENSGETDDAQSRERRGEKEATESEISIKKKRGPHFFRSKTVHSKKLLMGSEGAQIPAEETPEPEEKRKRKFRVCNSMTIIAGRGKGARGGGPRRLILHEGKRPKKNLPGKKS